MTTPEFLRNPRTDTHHAFLDGAQVSMCGRLERFEGIPIPIGEEGKVQACGHCKQLLQGRAEWAPEPPDWRKREAKLMADASAADVRALCCACVLSHPETGPMVQEAWDRLQRELLDWETGGDEPGLAGIWGALLRLASAARKAERIYDLVDGSHPEAYGEREPWQS